VRYGEFNLHENQIKIVGYGEFNIHENQTHRLLLICILILFFLMLKLTKLRSDYVYTHDLF